MRETYCANCCEGNVMLLLREWFFECLLHVLSRMWTAKPCVSSAWTCSGERLRRGTMTSFPLGTDQLCQDLGPSLALPKPCTRTLGPCRPWQFRELPPNPSFQVWSVLLDFAGCCYFLYCCSVVQSKTSHVNLYLRMQLWCVLIPLKITSGKVVLGGLDSEQGCLSFLRSLGLDKRRLRADPTAVYSFFLRGCRRAGPDFFLVTSERTGAVLGEG